MLSSAENMPMESKHISYTFVLLVEVGNTLSYTLSPVIQKYTRFVNVAWLYLPYFTTFRNQTWQFYQI